MYGASLIRYDAMCRAIEDAYQVDEVKDIRDKALAFETYSRLARNRVAERHAREIRVRAERKVGQLLSKMEKAKGARLNGRRTDGKYRQSHDETTETLADLGISKTQSSKWQQLAAVQAEKFEAALAAPENPTTTGIINGAKQARSQQADDRAHWLWIQLREFERLKVLDADPGELFDSMPARMRADTRRLAGPVCDWLETFVAMVRRIDGVPPGNGMTPASTTVTQGGLAQAVGINGPPRSEGEDDRVTSPNSVNPQRTGAPTHQAEPELPESLDRRVKPNR